MKKMTCEEFLDILNNEYYFSDIHAEMYWNQSLNSLKLFELMKTQAKKRNVELSDAQDWDFDKQLTENYKSDSDKGLS
jgi:hypothetical protein